MYDIDLNPLLELEGVSGDVMVVGQ